MDETKKDFKQVMVYVLMVVMGIIGWFLNDFMEDTDKSFGNIYAYRDGQNQLIIEHWKGEAFYYRDRYYNRLEAQIDGTINQECEDE